MPDSNNHLNVLKRSETKNLTFFVFDDFSFNEI